MSITRDTKKRRAVTKLASENGPLSSSEEASFGTKTLASRERSSRGAARTRDRLAVGRAAEQRDRSAPRASSSSQSKDHCPAPGLTRTAGRALSSHCKKESTMPEETKPDYVGIDI